MSLIVAMLSKNFGWFLWPDCIPLRFTVSYREQINDFWFTKTGIVWLAVNLCKLPPAI